MIHKGAYVLHHTRILHHILCLSRFVCWFSGPAFIVKVSTGSRACLCVELYPGRAAASSPSPSIHFPAASQQRVLPSCFSPPGNMAAPAPAVARSSGPALCPSFAEVCSFLERYGATLDLPEMTFPQMERYLRDTSTGESRRW